MTARKEPSSDVAHPILQRSCICNEGLKKSKAAS